MAAPVAIIPVQLDTSGIARQLSDGLLRAQRAVKPLNVRISPLPLSRITADVLELGKSMDAATARVIAFGATTSVIYGVGRAFSFLLDSTVLVEKRMLAISSILNTSNAGFKKLSDGLFRIANETSTSFQVASEAAEEFARQGLPLNETLKRTKDAMVLMKLSGIDAKDAVSNLTAAVNTFKKEALDTATIVNKLATVDAAYSVSQKDLSEAIARAGASAQDAGLNFDELIGTVTALQQVTARGGPVIGNALKSILTRTQRADVLDTLRDLGVEVESMPGKVRPALEILKDLAGKYKGLSDAQKSLTGEKVAGIYQINQFKALIGILSQANSLVDQATQTSRDSTNNASSRVKELNTSLSALAQQAGNNLTQLFAKIGEVSLAPGLKNALKSFNSFFREAGENENSQGLGQKIGNGILSGIGSALSGPGAFLAIAVVGGAVKKLGSFVLNAVKDLSSLNRGTQQQQLLQGSINNLLANGNAYYTNRYRLASSETEQQRIILSLLRQQNAEIARQGARGAAIGGKLAKQYTGSESGRITPRAAQGYIPDYDTAAAMSEEQGDINAGIGGAIGAKPKVISNFNFGNGQKGDIVANTKEVAVNNFAGGDGTAIFNPKMVSAIGGMGKLKKLGDVKNLASGFIPNYARTSPAIELGGLLGSGSYKRVYDVKSIQEDLFRENKYGSDPSKLVAGILHRSNTQDFVKQHEFMKSGLPVPNLYGMEQVREPRYVNGKLAGYRNKEAAIMEKVSAFDPHILEELSIENGLGRFGKMAVQSNISSVLSNYFVKKGYIGGFHTSAKGTQYAMEGDLPLRNLGFRDEQYLANDALREISQFPKPTKYSGLGSGDINYIDNIMERSGLVVVDSGFLKPRKASGGYIPNFARAFAGEGAFGRYSRFYRGPEGITPTKIGIKEFLNKDDAKNISQEIAANQVLEKAQSLNLLPPALHIPKIFGIKNAFTRGSIGKEYAEGKKATEQTYSSKTLGGYANYNRFLDIHDDSVASLSAGISRAIADGTDLKPYDIHTGNYVINDRVVKTLNRYSALLAKSGGKRSFPKFGWRSLGERILKNPKNKVSVFDPGGLDDDSLPFGERRITDSKPYIDLLEQRAGKKPPTIAGGYIPNFANPLQEAIKREKQATGKIPQVGYDNRVGVGVFSPDQGSLSNAINQHLKYEPGRTLSNIKETGQVPNFAPKLSPASAALGIAAIQGDVDKYLRQQQRINEEKARELLISKALTDDGLTRLERSKLTALNAAKIADELGTTIKEVNTLRKSNPAAFAKSGISDAIFGGARRAAQSQVRNGLQEKLIRDFTENIVAKAGVLSNTSKIRDRFLNANKGNVDEGTRKAIFDIARDKKTENVSKLEQRAFMASFAIPFATEFAVNAFGNPNTQGGRLASGVGRSAGTALSAASLGAQSGSLKGGLALGGLLLGAGISKGITNASAPSFDRFSQELSNVSGKIEEQENAISTVVSQIQNVREVTDAGGSPAAIARAKKLARESLAEVRPGPERNRLSQFVGASKEVTPDEIAEFLSTRGNEARLKSKAAKSALRIAEVTENLPSSSNLTTNLLLGSRRSLIGAATGNTEIDRAARKTFSFVTGGKEATLDNIRSEFPRLRPSELNAAADEVIGNFSAPGFKRENINIAKLEESKKNGVSDISLLDKALKAGGQELESRTTLIGSILATNRDDSVLILDKVIAYLKEDKEIAKEEAKGNKIAEFRSANKLRAQDVDAISAGIGFSTRNFSAKSSLATNSLRARLDNSGIAPLGQIAANEQISNIEARKTFIEGFGGAVQSPLSVIREVLDKNKDKINVGDTQSAIATSLTSIAKSPTTAFKEFGKIVDSLDRLGTIPKENIEAIQEAVSGARRQVGENQQEYTNRIAEARQESSLLREAEVKRRNLAFLGGDFNSVANNKSLEYSQGLAAFGTPLIKSRDQKFANQYNAPILAQRAGVYEQLFKDGLISPESKMADVGRKEIEAAAKANYSATLDELLGLTKDKNLRATLEGAKGNIDAAAAERAKAVIPLSSDAALSKGISDTSARLDIFSNLIKENVSNTDALKVSTEAINKLSLLIAKNTPGEPESKPGAPATNQAKGFVPNFSAFAREISAIKGGVGGARIGDRPTVKHINGLGKAVVNTGEKIVRNFMGSGKDAVFNRSMIGAVGDPSLFGNVENVAGGFVPNFATGSDIKDFLNTKTGQQLYRKVLEQRGYSPKQAEAFLKSGIYKNARFDVANLGPARGTYSMGKGVSGVTTLSTKVADALLNYKKQGIIGKIKNYGSYRDALGTLAHEETHRLQFEAKRGVNKPIIDNSSSIKRRAMDSFSYYIKANAAHLKLTYDQTIDKLASNNSISRDEFIKRMVGKEVEAYSTGNAAATPLKYELNNFKDRFTSKISGIGSGVSSLAGRALRKFTPSVKGLDILVNNSSKFAGGKNPTQFLFEKAKARLRGINLVHTDGLDEALRGNEKAKIYDPSAQVRETVRNAGYKNTVIAPKDPVNALDKYKETVGNKYLPKTRLASDLRGGLKNGSQIISNAVKALGPELIAKPLDGAAGKGIVRDAQNLKNLGNRKISNYLLQEQYKVTGREYRAHVATNAGGVAQSFGPALARNARSKTLGGLFGGGGINRAIELAARNAVGGIPSKNGVFGVDVLEIDKKFAKAQNAKLGYEKFSSGRGLFGLGPTRYFGAAELNASIADQKAPGWGSSSSTREDLKVQSAYRDYIKAGAAGTGGNGFKMPSLSSIVSGAGKVLKKVGGASVSVGKNLGLAYAYSKANQFVQDGAFSETTKNTAMGALGVSLAGFKNTRNALVNAAKIPFGGGKMGLARAGFSGGLGLGVAGLASSIGEQNSMFANPETRKRWFFENIVPNEDVDYSLNSKAQNYIDSSVKNYKDGNSSLLGKIGYGAAEGLGGLIGGEFGERVALGAMGNLQVSIRSGFQSLFGKKSLASTLSDTAPQTPPIDAPDLSNGEQGATAGQPMSAKAIAAAQYVGSLTKDLQELSGPGLDPEYRNQLFAASSDSLKGIQAGLAAAKSANSTADPQAAQIYQNYIKSYGEIGKSLKQNAADENKAFLSNLGAGFENYDPLTQAIIAGRVGEDDDYIASQYGDSVLQAKRDYAERFGAKGNFARGYIPNFAKSIIKRFGPLGTLQNLIQSDKSGKEARQYISQGGLPQSYVNAGYNANDLGAINAAIEREKDALYERGISRNLAKGYIFAGYHPRIGVGIGNTIDEPAGRYNTTAGLAQGINRVVAQGGNPAKSGVPNYAADSAPSYDALVAAINALISSMQQSPSGNPNAGSVQVDHNINVNASINGQIESNNANVQAEVTNAMESLKTRLAALEAAQKTGKYTPPPPVKNAAVAV